MSLTPKQGQFVTEYISDSNATAAAIRSGYSKKTAASQGERLLRNVEIKAAIEAIRAPAREAAGLTLESHLETLAELRDAAKGANQFAAAINAEISRGKAAGLYVEKHEHSGSLKLEQILSASRNPELMPVSTAGNNGNGHNRLNGVKL